MDTQDYNTDQKTVSTLLVPSRYILYFIKQCKLHRSKSKYFQYLLESIGNQVKYNKKKIQKHKADKWKISYQQKDTGLVKCSFRPDPAHWEQLRNTASGFGVSMCFLFVFLMELEMSDDKTQSNGNCGNYNGYSPKRVLKAVGCIRWIEFHPRRLKRKIILRC